MSTPSPWQSGTHAGLVSLGTHSLYLVGAGPPRPMTRTGHLQPAIIIEAGHCSGQAEWVAVSRSIAQRARVYRYDRAGYGRSEASPVAYSAANRVRDLAQLLNVAEIAPPYVLVGHSYGGVLVREFVRQYPELVAGMVLVDSARSMMVLPTGWESLLGEDSYYAVVGLDANHVMGEEEYQAIKEDERRNLPAARLEGALVEESTKEVNEAMPEGCLVLGDHRVSVIFANMSVDFRKIYDHAVENEIGTEDAQRQLAVRLEDMAQVDEAGQRAHLGLSRQSRFVYAEGKARTHNLQYVAPEVIRDEVFWVLGLTE
ncbi:hypothetical protein ASPCADRAFT_6835 [Aspergillus carbonarius ITEM 5010]|uniref:AB hydrolase-1 domain-containing protein n=1 Tax=Aspergillus carbonarius (strain ITEM 5010) TaxID=602072 RepID=A0A1R3RHY3_ASPC5|nr:hypothetical protein ASPCADRAFT_406882 [Aspergillus carbonarius ITEM 5010]OOF94148.1 hypothetical protein ASPCADRAFT_6835 [Aspergillus carbonarius ITEM 5010]